MGTTIINRKDTNHTRISNLNGDFTIAILCQSMKHPLHPHNYHHPRIFTKSRTNKQHPSSYHYETLAILLLTSHQSLAISMLPIATVSMFRTIHRVPSNPFYGQTV